LLKSLAATTARRGWLLTELVEDVVATAAAPACGYLVVVAASEESLYRYLKSRLEADVRTRVILDRRRTSASPCHEDRRTRTAADPSSQRVAVIRLTDGEWVSLTARDKAGRGGREIMEGIEGLEDRQRVDRWLEESQYLIGRLIPAHLDDRDRLRARLEASEQDNQRVKLELGEARREIAELRAELEFHRGERASVAETFNAIVDQLASLQKPVNDISRRLHNGQPLTSGVGV
jgi:hypothetical protein